MKQSGGKNIKGVVLGFMAAVCLCLFLGPCQGCKILEVWRKELTKSQPHPALPRIVPCKEIVDDMRALWSFERNYAYRHKVLAASISDMGDGTGIGKNGFVLKPALWAARIDGDNAQPEAATYTVKNPATGRRESAQYFFGVFPVKADTGERDRFSVVIMAVPEKPAEDDSCFIALCGPVSLQNDFSFDKEWPVFQLKAKSAVVESLRNLQFATHAELIQRLMAGDMKEFVTKTFYNLYYPQEGEQH